MTEITIKRPDLGPDAENKVTAITFKSKFARESKRQGDVDAMVVYLLSNILKVDGEHQSIEWYDDVPNSVYHDFEKAFIKLIPFEERKWLALIDPVIDKDELEKAKEKIGDSGKK